MRDDVHDGGSDSVAEETRAVVADSRARRPVPGQVPNGRDAKLLHDILLANKWTKMHSI